MYIDYSIVSASALSQDGAIVQLCQEVKELMKHGWQPIGGAFNRGTEWRRGYTYYVYCQTLGKVAEVP